MAKEKKAPKKEAGQEKRPPFDSKKMNDPEYRRSQGVCDG